MESNKSHIAWRTFSDEGKVTPRSNYVNDSTTFEKQFAIVRNVCQKRGMEERKRTKELSS